METRASKSSLRNVPVANPGSSQRPVTRQLFRSPAPIVQLGEGKLARRSFVAQAEDKDNKETPKTLIAGFMASVNTQPVLTRTLRRRSERLSKAPPRMSDILKKQIQRQELPHNKQSFESPGSKLTPHTNVANFLAAAEEEQTPLQRAFKQRTPDLVPTENNRDWGQKLSISPMQNSFSGIEDISIEENSKGIKEQRTKRFFNFIKRNDVPVDKNKSKAPEDNLELTTDINVTSESDERRKEDIHHSRRQSSRIVKSTISTSTVKEVNPQNSVTIEDKSYLTEKVKSRSSISPTNATSTKLLDPQKDKMNYIPNQNVDSGEEDDLEHHQSVRFQMNRREKKAKELIGNMQEIGKKKMTIESIETRAISDLDQLAAVNSGNVGTDVNSPPEILMSKSNRSRQVLENSHQRVLQGEDNEEPILPLIESIADQTGRISKNVIEQEINPDKSQNSASRPKHSIRNISLLKSNAPLQNLPTSTKIQGEYELMDSSIDSQPEAERSKIFSTPPSKKKISRTNTPISNVSKRNQADKLNTPLPDSSNRSVQQSHAGFKVIGQRSSTPLIRSKSFLHSTKIQSAIPFDLTGNQTHLMDYEIRDISPIRPDNGTSRYKNVDQESTEDVELDTRTDKQRDNIHTARPSEIVKEHTDHLETRIEVIPAGVSLMKAGTSLSVNSHQETRAEFTGQQSTEAGELQPEVLQVTNRKRSLEPDDDINLPSGVSPMITPHFTMTKQAKVSTVQQGQKMKQTTLLSQAGFSRTPAEPTTAQNRKERVPRNNQSKKSPVKITLPRNTIKFFAERHSSMKLSRDAIDEIAKVSEVFWTDSWKALEAYALHAGRKSITEDDVILLMKTQRSITGISDLHDKIREHLPMELRAELIPLKL